MIVQLFKRLVILYVGEFVVKEGNERETSQEKFFQFVYFNEIFPTVFASFD